jgi:hypothetical protein
MVGFAVQLATRRRSAVILIYYPVVVRTVQQIKRWNMDIVFDDDVSFFFFFQNADRVDSNIVSDFDILGKGNNYIGVDKDIFSYFFKI